MKYERIIRALSNECWAILPEKLEQIVGVVEARVNGVAVAADDILEIEAARRKPVRNGRVAVLPMFGSISHRAGSIESSFGTSAEQFGRDFDSLMDSPEVGGLILDVDSPGGSVSGIQELADKIRGRRGEKPIVAVANANAFSAAFWIATAADELVVTPSGSVGSVGVVAMHEDQSEMNEKIGLKPTFIHAGKNKIEGNPHAPLDQESHAEIQRHVDRHHDAFVSALAKNRDTTDFKVRNNFGGGRIFGGKEAIERGMADRVATFEQIIAEMTGTLQPKKSTRADVERRKLEASRLN